MDASEMEWKTEEYLSRLSTALGAVSPAERAEIVSDIRSLVAERLAEQGSAIDAVLARLGSPETLATAYRTEGLLTAAAKKWSPLPLMSSVGLWATRGVEGFVAFVVLLIGYTLSLALVVSAAAKPFWPNQIGFWWDPPSLTIGLHTPDSTTARDLLGFWLIPVGLAAGTAMFALTTMFVRYLIRRHRNARLGSLRPLMS